MSYTLAYFGTHPQAPEPDYVALPTYDPQINVGTGPSRAAMVDLPGGGVYDALGGERAPRGSAHITLRATLLGESEAALDSAYDELRAWRGKRDRLWRQRADGSLQWCLARLLEVKATRQAQHWRHLEVELDFAMLSPVWYGQEHDVVDTIPTIVTLSNGGNAPVRNAIVTVTAAGSDITTVTIGVTGVSALEWTGTLLIGKSLVIDCGARSVKKEGVDAYGGFNLTAEHRSDDWLRLEPGSNEVEVTRDEGYPGSTVQFTYSEGWE